MKSFEARSRGVTSLHVIIVALSLTMTVGAWLYSKNQVDLQTENRFLAAKDRTIGLIVDRMSRYEDALWSGVAHIDAKGGKTSHSEWKTFSGSLNLAKKYPGVNGIGVIYYVTGGNFLNSRESGTLKGAAFQCFRNMTRTSGCRSRLSNPKTSMPQPLAWMWRMRRIAEPACWRVVTLAQH